MRMTGFQHADVLSIQARCTIAARAPAGSLSGPEACNILVMFVQKLCKFKEDYVKVLVEKVAEAAQKRPG